MNPLNQVIRSLIIVQQNIGEIAKMVLKIQDVQLAALEGISTLKQQLAEALAQGVKDKTDLAFELTQNASDASTVAEAKSAVTAAKLLADEAQASADVAKLALEESLASEAIEDEDDQVSFQAAIDAINLAAAPEDLEDPV